MPRFNDDDVRRIVSSERAEAVRILPSDVMDAADAVPDNVRNVIFAEAMQWVAIQADLDADVTPDGLRSGATKVLEMVADDWQREQPADGE